MTKATWDHKRISSSQGILGTIAMLLSKEDAVTIFFHAWATLGTLDHRQKKHFDNDNGFSKVLATQ